MTHSAQLSNLPSSILVSLHQRTLTKRRLPELLSSDANSKRPAIEPTPARSRIRDICPRIELPGTKPGRANYGRPPGTFPPIPGPSSPIPRSPPACVSQTSRKREREQSTTPSKSQEIKTLQSARGLASAYASCWSPDRGRFRRGRRLSRRTCPADSRQHRHGRNVSRAR